MKTEELEDKEAVDEIEDDPVDVAVETEDLQDEEEAPETEGETPDDSEKDAEESEAKDDAEDDDDGEIVIEIEGETPTPEEAEKEDTPQWVKDTRKQNRELNKQKKQLEKELQELREKVSPKAEIPPEPHLWDDGIEGDEAKLIAAVRKRDRMIAAEEAEKQKAERERKLIDDEVDSRLTKYEERKKSIGAKISDYSESVTEAEEGLSDLQRKSIAYYFKESAAEVMYYLGKKPEQLKQIASIEDPTEMLIAVGEIKSKVRISKRKPKTNPETTVTGQSRIAGSDAYLERLEAQAEKTGDRTKINAYKRELREKAKSG